jgi:hypothetical protein
MRQRIEVKADIDSSTIIKIRKKVSGKQKGSTFERLICKKLSLLISKGEREDCFWRSAMSGGRATVQFNKGILNKSQAGDVTAIAKEGQWLTDHFVLEVKHYKDLNIPQSLIRNYGNLYSFWVRLKKDSKKYDKAPCLIARQNSFPILVITEIGKPLGFGRLFQPSPVISLHRWGAEIYLFEDYVKMQEQKKKRVRLE